MGDAADEDFPDQLGVLRRLAEYKYDDYQQYAPGRQFVECLALWLDQFESSIQRRHAMNFVLERLIFLSDVEMRHFVNLMASVKVPQLLIRRISQRLALPHYRVSKIRSSPGFARSLRASLFLGMSDGARIDQFRRFGHALSNEQIALNYELSESRAEKMNAKLRADLSDDEAVFEHVFLVDDFAGSGSTIVRQNLDGSLDGRLVRFLNDTLPKLQNGCFPKIIVALYVATDQALENIQSQISSFPSPPWTDDNAPELLNVLTIPEESRLSHGRVGAAYKTDRHFDNLLHIFYDPSVEDEHKGEVLHGYLDCGLPLVLSHNTPNNSVYLLWEKEFTTPLFPRFERHQGRVGDE